MKYEEYIKKLDNLNEEFEEGLLLELQEKPPTNLHGEIMKSVNRERKRVNFFNYRIYAPAVAAVLILAVVINRPEILEKISFIKNAKVTREQTIANSESADPKKKLEHGQNSEKVAANSTEKNNGIIDNQKPEINKADTETAGGQNSNSNQSEPKENAPGVKDNSAKDQKVTDNTIVATTENTNNTKTAANKGNTDSEMKDYEEGNINILELIGLAFFKEPEINYEIVLDDNRSAVLNFITENYVENLNTPNTYKLSSEQFESLDKLLVKYNIGKKALNGTELSGNKVVKIYLVNYHIPINISAPDIVSFIDDQSKCIKVNDATYKITADDMKQLDKKLSASGIKKEFISEVEDKYVIFKVSVINYEVNINASQNAVFDFIKNTEKCKPAGDSIYKMSRDTFNEFKELLGNSNLELKVLNETNNNDIMVKVTGN